MTNRLRRFTSRPCSLSQPLVFKSTIWAAPKRTSRAPCFDSAGTLYYQTSSCYPTSNQRDTSTTRAPSTTTHAATFRRILKAGEQLLSRTQGLSAEHYVRALLQTRKLTDGKRAELGQSHALLLCRCQHGLYSNAQAIHGQIRQHAIYHTAHYMCVADS